jgi:pilus assembly protein CpaE
MAAEKESRVVLLISIDEKLITAVREQLQSEKHIQLLTIPEKTDEIIPFIAEKQPQIILLDHGYYQQKTVDRIDQITSEFTTSPLVAILPEAEVGKSERVILAGARAFILYPFKSDNLLVSIRRVLELTGRNQGVVAPESVFEPDQKPRNTFTVFSPKGGAGSTTVATNLAIMLHKTLKEDVLLIDGKHIFGHVSLYMNLRTGNSLTDLISHVGMLDQRLIKQVVVRHISGVYVLPSPTSIIEAQGIRPDDLFKIMQAMQNVFPNIIIDGGNNLNDNTVTYMDSSDKVLLVLNPDLASLRDVTQFMEVAKTLSYPPEKVLLILNLTGHKADVKREEIEQILKMKIFGKIPADENLALSCINEGVPIVLKSPNHMVSKAYAEIARDLAKVIQSTKSDYLNKVKSESSDALKKSSKLG